MVELNNTVYSGSQIRHDTSPRHMHQTVNGRLARNITHSLTGRPNR